MTEAIERDAALATAKALAEAGLLTEREAQAHVLTRVYDWGVSRAAAAMGVSESRVYNARSSAAADLGAAERTFDLLDRIEAGEDLVPTHCAECGDALDEWTVSDGHVSCPGCVRPGGSHA